MRIFSIMSGSFKVGVRPFILIAEDFGSYLALTYFILSLIKSFLLFLSLVFRVVLVELANLPYGLVWPKPSTDFSETTAIDFCLPSIFLDLSIGLLVKLFTLYIEECLLVGLVDR